MPLVLGRRKKVAQPPPAWEGDHMHKLYNILEFTLLTQIISEYFLIIYCFIDLNARKTLLYSES